MPPSAGRVLVKTAPELLGEFQRAGSFTPCYRHIRSMETVECTVCGDDVGLGPAGLGLKIHSKKHRREFRELTGREPRDYDEVREFFDSEGRQPTLGEAIVDDEQVAILDY